MLRGIAVVNVDPKGRFAMPVRYRPQLELGEKPQLVVTIDTEERCLLLYPMLVWEDIENKLSKLPSFDPATRRVQRLLIGHATECECDGQGRLLIPSELRDYAGIEKKLVLLGQGNKLEIWGEDVWTLHRASLIDGDRATHLPEDLKSLSL